MSYFTAELEQKSDLNAKVLNAAGLNSNGTFPLEHFSYNNSVLLDVIFRHVQETNFSGITVGERRRWHNYWFTWWCLYAKVLFLLCRVLSHLVRMAFELWRSWAWCSLDGWQVCIPCTGDTKHWCLFSKLAERMGACNHVASSPGTARKIGKRAWSYFQNFHMCCIS